MTPSHPWKIQINLLLVYKTSAKYLPREKAGGERERKARLRLVGGRRVGWWCKQRGCCTAQPHTQWVLAAGAWGKGMLSPSPWEPGLELQGRLRQGGESVMGAPCSLLAPRQQASGWVGRGGECSRDGGSFYMRSCSLGSLQLPREQVKHLALGGLVGTKPALTPRGSCWGGQQLAPQYRGGMV